MSKNLPPEKLSLEYRMLTFEATKENVLFIISKDPTAFTIRHSMEVAKNAPAPDKVADKLALYLELREKGYIYGDAFENKLTIKGRFWLFSKKDAWTFWGLVVAIIGIVVAIVLKFT